MKIFVSPEMLSKPVPHTLGGEKSSFPWLCLSGKVPQGAGHICRLSPGLCSSSFGNHWYYLPRHGNVHSTWSNGELSLGKVSAVPACVGSPFLCPPPLPGPWRPGTWWWTRAEPTSLQWLSITQRPLEKKQRAALQTRQMAAKCKSNGCRWWAWGWRCGGWRKSGFEPVTMEQYHSIRITAVRHWSLLVSPRRNKWLFLKLSGKKKWKSQRQVQW